MRLLPSLALFALLISNSGLTDVKEAVGTVGPVDPPASKVTVRDAAGRTRETVGGTSLFTQEHVLPKQGQTVGVTLKDGSEITAEAGSDLSISDYVPGDPSSVPHAELDQGSAHFNVSHTTTGKTSFFLKTNSAVMGVRGTEFVVDQAADGTSNLHTLQGEVAMAKSENDLATPGHFTSVGAGTTSYLKRSMAAPAAPQKFDRQAYLGQLAKTHPGLAKHVRPVAPARPAARKKPSMAQRVKIRPAPKAKKHPPSRRRRNQ